MNIRTGMGKVQIKYDNGYTLSIANGFGSYTENHFDVDKYTKIIDNKDIFASWTSEEVEIAVIGPRGIFITDEVIEGANDIVITVSVKKLIEIMFYLMSKEELK